MQKAAKSYATLFLSILYSSISIIFLAARESSTHLKSTTSSPNAMAASTLGTRGGHLIDGTTTKGFCPSKCLIYGFRLSITLTLRQPGKVSTIRSLLCCVVVNDVIIHLRTSAWLTAKLDSDLSSLTFLAGSDLFVLLAREVSFSFLFTYLTDFTDFSVLIGLTVFDLFTDFSGFVGYTRLAILCSSSASYAIES